MTLDIEAAVRRLRPADGQPSGEERTRSLIRLREVVEREERPVAPARRIGRIRMRPLVSAAVVMVLALVAVATARELIAPATISSQLPGSPGGGWTELGTASGGSTSISIASDDESFCARFDSSVAGIGSGGMCGGTIPESGVALRWSCGGVDASHPVEYAMLGIVADDVDRVQVRTFDGDRHDVDVRRNTLSVIVADPGAAPKTIVVERSGARYEVQSPPLGCS